MIERKKVLVFPAGTEVGLEICRQLRFSKQFELLGLNSSSDHSAFVYPRVRFPFPFLGDPGFEQAFTEVLNDEAPDLVLPAHDDAIVFLARSSAPASTVFVAPPREKAEILRSKSKTYAALDGIVPVPQLFTAARPPGNTADRFFVKPDQGQGSRGAQSVTSFEEALDLQKRDPSLIVCEFLPGEEFTVDCFTDRHGELLFCNARNRLRISNGIAVRSSALELPGIEQVAAKISKTLQMRGAWFFQVKRRESGELVLMEAAARIAGTMGLSRMLGPNFAELTLYDRLNFDVRVIRNRYSVTADRALETKFSIDIEFDNVYIDFDDTILCTGKVVPETMAFLYQMLNEGKRLILITRHRDNLAETLAAHRLGQMFDEVIHLVKGERKSDFIKRPKSIFIDDSFSERYDVASRLGLSVFSPDMLEVFS